MKRLYLDKQTLIVRRTGLPFYDAARVIGVAQIFFGTAEATSTEQGFGWQISGVSDLQKPDTSRLWIGERLRELKAAKRDALLHKRLQEWEAGKLDKSWLQIVEYFKDPFKPIKLAKENIYYEVDASLQAGMRGSDPKAYATFASGSGPDIDCEAISETLAAMIGLSFAACVKNDKGNRFLLPIFGASDVNTRRNPPLRITISKYWNYNRFFSHCGGENIASTWAMLSMLEALYDEGMPVLDFAYNHAASPQYHSGTMGAEQLCVRWSQWNASLGDIRVFLANSADKTRSKGKVLELAREVSDFTRNFDAASLERIVRLKVRLMAEDDGRAYALFNKSTTHEEIQTQMAIPEVPTRLCIMVAKALSLPDKKDTLQSTTTGDIKPTNEWIGQYIKLENAGDVYRFYSEIERLLSRSPLAKGEGMYRFLSYNMEQPNGSMTKHMDSLKPRQTFRAWRAAFLLKVLQNIALTFTPNTNMQSSDNTPNGTSEEQGEPEE